MQVDIHLCPNCGSIWITIEMNDYHFQYGQEEGAVQLSARIPVCKCWNCGLEFCNHEAEDLIQEAIDRYNTPGD